MTASKQDDEQQRLYPPQSAQTAYGTFQGFPQPVHPSQLPQYGSQNFQGYGRIEQGIPVDPHHHHHHHHDYENQPHYRRRRLPCCGLGVGWLMFILGFFTLSIPWFVGAVIFFCFEHDPREHVGLGACAIAAVIAFFVGGTTGLRAW